MGKREAEHDPARFWRWTLWGCALFMFAPVAAGLAQLVTVSEGTRDAYGPYGLVLAVVMILCALGATITGLLDAFSKRRAVKKYARRTGEDPAVELRVSRRWLGLSVLLPVVSFLASTATFRLLHEDPIGFLGAATTILVGVVLVFLFAGERPLLDAVDRHDEA